MLLRKRVQEYTIFSRTFLNSALILQHPLGLTRYVSRVPSLSPSLVRCQSSLYQSYIVKGLELMKQQQRMLDSGKTPGTGIILLHTATFPLTIFFFLLFAAVFRKEMMASGNNDYVQCNKRRNFIFSTLFYGADYCIQGRRKSRELREKTANLLNIVSVTGSCDLM